jgi:hypothetical protein
MQSTPLIHWGQMLALWLVLREQGQWGQLRDGATLPTDEELETEVTRLCAKLEWRRGD